MPRAALTAAWAILACALLFAPPTQADPVNVVVPDGYEVMAVDGRYVYTAFNNLTQRDHRAQLVRIDTADQTTRVIYREESEVAGIDFVAARNGKVAFVTQVVTNGWTVSVPWEGISTLRVIEHEGDEPKVVGSVVRRENAEGKPYATCGGEFAHVSFISDNRLQTMITHFGTKVGTKRCKAQSYGEAFGPRQFQTMRWLTLGGRTTRTYRLDMGENLEQHGGVFSFSDEGNEFAYPKRKRFRVVRMRDDTRRSIRPPDAYRVNYALALSKGTVLVDYLLKNQSGKLRREQRLYPNVFASRRSFTVQRLSRGAMEPERCGTGWITENAAGTAVVKYERDGHTSQRIYAGWSGQTECGRSTVLFDLGETPAQLFPLPARPPTGG